MSYHPFKHACNYIEPPKHNGFESEEKKELENGYRLTIQYGCHMCGVTCPTSVLVGSYRTAHEHKHNHIDAALVVVRCPCVMFCFLLPFRQRAAAAAAAGQKELELSSIPKQKTLIKANV